MPTHSHTRTHTHAHARTLSLSVYLLSFSDIIPYYPMFESPTFSSSTTPPLQTFFSIINSSSKPGGRGWEWANHFLKTLSTKMLNRSFFSANAAAYLQRASLAVGSFSHKLQLDERLWQLQIAKYYFRKRGLPSSFKFLSPFY